MNKAKIKLAFRLQVIIDPVTHCWLWTGSQIGKGYGQTTKENRFAGEVRAHRCAWQLYRGPIPEGIYVLHTCDVRHCVNPRHLYLGTAKDNAADCVKRKRHSRLGKHWSDADKARIGACHKGKKSIAWNKGLCGVQSAWNKGIRIGPAAALKAWETKRQRLEVTP